MKVRVIDSNVPIGYCPRCGRACAMTNPSGDEAYEITDPDRTEWETDYSCPEHGPFTNHYDTIDMFEWNALTIVEEP